MIYVSTSCLSHRLIQYTVQEFAENGFTNIELSGGTDYDETVETDLLEFKQAYGLNFLCHNYFPPPREHFVLNLASLNDAIYEKSIKHLKNAIDMSKTFEAQKFGFHAGFFTDIRPEEIGRPISRSHLYDRDKAMKRFVEGVEELKLHAGNLQIYIENNVYSAPNYRTFNGAPLFMLCDYKDWTELKQKVDVNLLLDLAHLKVSANTLNLNFQEELSNMIRESDYIHVSDNDGLEDLNLGLREDSELLQYLPNKHINEPVYTIEVYEGLHAIKKTHEILTTEVS